MNMKWKIGEIPDEEDTFVMLMTTCPLCNKAVRFVMHEDKSEIIDARIEYLEKKVRYWENRAEVLTKCINAVLLR